MKPESLRFAKTHEWVSVDGNVATVGISDFAVQLLTDVVFLDLPRVGRTVRQSETIGEIESVKAVSDLYSPVSGEVIEVNSGLPDNLALLTENPFGDAWMVKIRMTEPGQVDGLMDFAAYKQHCEHEAH